MRPRGHGRLVGIEDGLVEFELSLDGGDLRGSGVARIFGDFHRDLLNLLMQIDMAQSGDAGHEPERDSKERLKVWQDALLRPLECRSGLPQGVAVTLSMVTVHRVPSLWLVTGKPM